MMSSSSPGQSGDTGANYLKSFISQLQTKKTEYSDLLSKETQLDLTIKEMETKLNALQAEKQHYCHEIQNDLKVKIQDTEDMMTDLKQYAADEKRRLDNLTNTVDSIVVVIKSKVDHKKELERHFAAQIETNKQFKDRIDHRTTYHKDSDYMDIAGIQMLYKEEYAHVIANHSTIMPEFKPRSTPPKPNTT